MDVEAKTARVAVQDRPAFKANDLGTKIEALNYRSELALAGMQIMTISDWDALKFELHQKFLELRHSGYRLWQTVKPELETKVAALEESIRLSSPCSGNFRRELRGQGRNNPTALLSRRNSKGEVKWKV
jgi:hypothetical protein